MKLMVRIALGRQRLDHLGEDDVGVAAEVVAEAAVVARLDPEVELREDRAPELLDGGDRRQRRDRGDQRSAGARPCRITARSKVQSSTTLGRRTLTATMRPSGRRALWTCDTDAEASGTGANSA